MSIRRILAGAAVPLGLLACGSAPSGDEHAEKGSAALSSISGQIKSSGGLCLDVFANSQQSGAAVDIATCNGTAAQTFTYTPGGAGPIKNTASGLCLDDVWGGGQVLQMVTCMGTPEQTWRIDATSADAKIVDSYGHCLDVLYNRQVNGQTVDPATCNGTGAQIWHYAPQCQPGLAPDLDGRCVCDETLIPARVSSQLFYDLVAYPLSGIKVHFPDQNGLLDVTLPSSLGLPPIAPSTLNFPGVGSLDMPSQWLGSPGSWTWAMDPNSATMTVTTTLDAVVSGQGPFGCGVTVTIRGANVTMVLVPVPGKSALTVQSVSVPLQAMSRGQGNSSVSGCDATPRDDILGNVQNQLQGGLQSEFNQQGALLGPAGLLNGVVTTLANDDPSAVGVPDKSRSVPGTTWSCANSYLGSGVIVGGCSRVCPR